MKIPNCPGDDTEGEVETEGIATCLIYHDENHQERRIDTATEDTDRELKLKYCVLIKGNKEKADYKEGLKIVKGKGYL